MTLLSLAKAATSMSAQAERDRDTTLGVGGAAVAAGGLGARRLGRNMVARAQVSDANVRGSYARQADELQGTALAQRDIRERAYRAQASARSKSPKRARASGNAAASAYANQLQASHDLKQVRAKAKAFVGRTPGALRGSKALRIGGTIAAGVGAATAAANVGSVERSRSRNTAPKVKAWERAPLSAARAPVAGIAESKAEGDRYRAMGSANRRLPVSRAAQTTVPKDFYERNTTPEKGD